MQRAKRSGRNTVIGKPSAKTEPMLQQEEQLIAAKALIFGCLI
jgi:hypothetical protein